MGFELPSLEQTRQRVGTDLEAYLPGTAANTRRTAVGVIAHAQAGAVRGLHAHIEHRERNFLPDERADAEGIERWARLLGLWYRDPTAAAGPVGANGSVGAILPAGTRLQSGLGTVYSTREMLTLTAASGTVTVDAEDAGAAGNLPAGSRLSLLSPVPGIQSTLTVGTGGLTGGADTEKLDSLGARVRNRLRQPPMGGSLPDYTTWAREAHPAVTRAWVTEYEQGAGSVTVRVVCDNEVTPIPGAEVLDAVETYIGERRQAGRKSVYVLPPVGDPVHFQIRLLPDTTAIRAAVEAELHDLLRREAEPSGTLLITHMREAVSTAAGEFDHELVAPTANLPHTTGRMAVFGSITWL